MLQAPMEILELADKQVIELTIENWIKEDAVIRPAHAPQGKVIEVLRVFVPKSVKPLFPHYFDITSKTLVAQLLPFLEAGLATSKKFRVTAHGDGVQKRFALEVV